VLLRASLLLALLFPCIAGANSAAELSAQAEFRARFGPQTILVWDAMRGVPSAVLGLELTLPGKTPVLQARTFLQRHGALLGINPQDLMAARQSGFHKRPVVHFQQSHGGVPVEGRFVALSFDESHRLIRVSSDWMPLGSAQNESTVNEAKVRAAITQRYPGSPQGKLSKVIVANAPRLMRVTWRVPVAILPPFLIRMLWIDGESGKILQDRMVGKDVPGEVVR